MNTIALKMIGKCMKRKEINSPSSLKGLKDMEELAKLFQEIADRYEATLNLMNETNQKIKEAISIQEKNQEAIEKMIDNLEKCVDKLPHW